MKCLEHIRLPLDLYRRETGDLSLAEIGMYMRLVMHQITTGGIPNDPERINAICGAVVDPTVIGKFGLGADGMLRTPWIEQERKREERVSKARANVARDRWDQDRNCSTIEKQLHQNLCECGCKKLVKPGRKFASRSCSNRWHAQHDAEFKKGTVGNTMEKIDAAAKRL